MARCDLGVIGLATMGANLARNAARKGCRVAVHNRTWERTETLLKNYGHEGDFAARPLAVRVRQFLVEAEDRHHDGAGRQARRRVDR